MRKVTDNLNNSFFAKRYNCLHRAQSISQYGENVLAETAFTIQASIQPTAGKELQLLPDKCLLTENITIYSKEMLTSEEVDGYGDIILYDNNRYQVVKAKKWVSHCEAIATLEAINAQ